MRVLPVSLIGSRRTLKKSFKALTKDKNTGYVSEVQLTRVGFRLWHLQFQMETK